MYILAGLQFVVLHTRAGAVRWFKVSPVSALSTAEPKA
jgi:magnesium and cobalt transporter